MGCETSRWLWGNRGYLETPQSEKMSTTATLTPLRRCMLPWLVMAWGKEGLIRTYWYSPHTSMHIHTSWLVRLLSIYCVQGMPVDTMYGNSSIDIREKKVGGVELVRPG